jgi:hypothetical protein
MTAKKKTITKKAAKGKSADRQRAEQIVKTNRHGDRVSAALTKALDMDAETLRLALEKVDELERLADTTRKDAIDYAFKAFGAALDHFAATEGDPFTRSRLAVVYGEQQPGDLHMVVTLSGTGRDKAITDEDLQSWIEHVEIICRTLEHPDCSKDFERAFGAVFTDNILDASNVSWTTPTVVRVMLPLALMSMVKRTDGDPDQMLAILQTLNETLNDDETTEAVRASVRRKRGGDR